MNSPWPRFIPPEFSVNAYWNLPFGKRRSLSSQCCAKGSSKSTQRQSLKNVSASLSNNTSVGTTEDRIPKIKSAGRRKEKRKFKRPHSSDTCENVSHHFLSHVVQHAGKCSQLGLKIRRDVSTTKGPLWNYVNNYWYTSINSSENQHLSCSKMLLKLHSWLCKTWKITIWS